jgi:excisionase family DNA binding protein
MSNITAKTERAAYPVAQLAAALGRHPSFVYRLLYSGKIKAIANAGAALLIPRSELERFLAQAAPYDPKPRKRKVKKGGKLNAAVA